MDFKMGDPVMHWTYGLGEIIGLEERALAGQKALYYVVRVQDMTVWVPADETIGHRLRLPTKKAGFKPLLAILTSPARPLPMDRQERRLQLMEQLQDGRPESLCCVIRDLTAFQRLRPLNDTDQSLMKRAREALLGEWGYAFSIQPAQARADLHKLLMISSSPAG